MVTEAGRLVSRIKSLMGVEGSVVFESSGVSVRFLSQCPFAGFKLWIQALGVGVGVGELEAGCCIYPRDNSEARSYRAQSTEYNVD